MTLEEFFQGLCSTGAGFLILHYLNMEEFLFFASCSSTIWKSIKKAIEYSPHEFKQWRLDPSVYQTEGIRESRRNLMKEQEVIQYENRIEDVQCIRDWYRLHYNLRSSFEGSTFVASVAYGFFWLSSRKLSPVPNICRIYYKNEINGDLFILTGVNENRSVYDCHQSRKLEHYNSRGELLLLIGEDKGKFFVQTQLWNFFRNYYGFLEEDPPIMRLKSGTQILPEARSECKRNLVWLQNVTEVQKMVQTDVEKLAEHGVLNPDDLHWETKVCLSVKLRNIFHFSFKLKSLSSKF